MHDGRCDHSRAAGPRTVVFGNFRRPRYIVPARKLYSPLPTFSFTVKLAKAGVDLSPFTVRARGSSRLKVPGAGVRQASHEYALREFEVPDREGGSRRCELLCTPVTDRASPSASQSAWSRSEFDPALAA